MTTLNSVTLAEPAAGREGYRRSEVDVGATHELASGALVFDYITARYRHSLSWAGITAAERTTIKGAFDAAKAAAVAFVAPDAGNFTVLAVPNSWVEDYEIDRSLTARWFVSLQLQDSS